MAIYVVVQRDVFRLIPLAALMVVSRIFRQRRMGDSRGRRNTWNTNEVALKRRVKLVNHDRLLEILIAFSSIAVVLPLSVATFGNTPFASILAFVNYH